MLLPRNHGNVTLSPLYLKKNDATPIRSHTNASALVYCVQGVVNVSMAHPMNVVKTYAISSGQVVNIPQGLWHFIEAKEESRCLVILDHNEPRTVLASEVEERVYPSKIAAAKAIEVEICPYYYHHGTLSFPSDKN